MHTTRSVITAMIVVSALVAACSNARTSALPVHTPATVSSSSPSSEPTPSPFSQPTPTAEASSTPSPASTATPTRAPAARTTDGCPPGPATLEMLIGLRRDIGPLSRRYDDPLNERALQCYGSAELHLVAYVAKPEGLGGTRVWILKPRWLDSWFATTTFLAASDRERTPSAPFGPFLPVAVPATVRPTYDALHGQWVTASGRFDAKAAATCSADRYGAGDVPSQKEIVEMCRTSFVLTSIKPAPDPCPAKADLASIIATPEHLRADCFGGRKVSFVAVGYSINNMWPGLRVPDDLQDWMFGVQGRTAELQAFVPRSVPLPDPAGTPWHDSDGVGGPDVRWKVTGHFDDGMADECIPVKGDTIDDVPVVMSKGEVWAFCRDHYVVDRLTWLPTG